MQSVSSSMAKVGLAAFILLMCLVDVVWIRQNTAPPRMFDDSYYLIESVDLYHTLREQGPARFLVESTTHSRRGHPPMMKVLPVFVYLVLGPGTNAALYAYTLLISVFCVYLFLLARELLGRDAKALLAVIVACLFPVTYGMWRNVMAEFGMAVAVVGCLYHLLKCQGFRHPWHTVLVGCFLGWGLLWKVTFPVFVGGPLLLVFVRARRPLPMRNLVLAVVAVLVLAGPFYARSWAPVIAFALALSSPANQSVWGLGPVFSVQTLARYWLLVINWGISSYLFALLLVSWLVHVWRQRKEASISDVPFLLAWFLPGFAVLSFHALKEVRHLLPALPVVGIVIASLLTGVVAPLRRGVQIAVLVLLGLWPLYQFASSSFDLALLPRADLGWGPIRLSTADLEVASLEWMPSYTFPANRTKWPTGETLRIIADRAAASDGRARVHVTGTNPYFNGLVLAYQARLIRSPLVFDPPFDKNFAGADFVVTVLANRKYGPVDQRPTAVEQALREGETPFVEVGVRPLPDGGEVRIYEASGRREVVRAPSRAGHLRTAGLVSPVDWQTDMTSRGSPNYETRHRAGAGGCVMLPIVYHDETGAPFVGQ